MSRTSMFLLAASIAVVAASALVFLFYNHEISRARAEAGRGARIANTTAGPVEYAERGAGIPLLSIHGAGGGHDQGLANVADLVGGGFRVIAPSRFGYLGTPIPSNTSPAVQADAHGALLTELKIEKAIVIGISAGARSAIELALRHPGAVAALILIVPGTYAVNAGADFIWWATEKIAPTLLIRFIGVPPQVFAASPRAEQDRVMQIVRRIQPLSRRFPGINIDSNPDLARPPLEDIAVPTLVISARDDLFNTLPAAEFAASVIPNASLVVYDTGGHLLVGRQQDVRKVVADFIVKRVQSTAPGG